MSGSLWMLIGALVLGAVTAAWWYSGRQGGSMGETVKRLDRAHPVGAVDRDKRQEEAIQLHPNAPGIGPGLSIGALGEHGDRRLYQGWRECSVHVWGTGRGKTTSQVVRHAAEAPGAFLMTSNKVDGVTEVIAARRDRGRVWVFDPQRILDEAGEPTMTIDLFASVEDTRTADEVAAIFESASAGSAGASGRDPQFDSQGRDLLSACILAAAEDGREPATILDWITSGKLRDPETVLREHGHTGRAAMLRGISQQPDDTRGSVFATAQRMASALSHDALVRWATPTAGVRRFDPGAFVDSDDTLVLLAQDTAGSGAAFVSTVLHTVFTAAQKSARRNGGRLRVPLVADLDEVGNVVKLPALAEWYSYFGSMGIVVSAFFQTKGQGVTMLRHTGWETLWSAAAVRVYGGGVDDDKFLEQLSKVTGKYDHRTQSYSTSRGGGRSTSVQTQQREILPVDKLAALPPGRAWVRTNKGGGTIVRTLGWFADPPLAAWINEGLDEMKEAG
ncbi:type IV secretory system conjugative DNA transfer family protein [Kocuria sp. KH4]